MKRLNPIHLMFISLGSSSWREEKQEQIEGIEKNLERRIK